jgi:hypothetical protein
VKYLLLSATACLSLTVAGVALSQVVFHDSGDKAPVIHGEVKPPMAVPGVPVPQRTPGDLPGYPIDRLRQLREASK